MNKENLMREIKLEKVVLNIGGVAEKLDKGEILLKEISGKKPIKVKAVKRIPTWNVRPGLEVGVKVTLRGEDALKMVKKLLPAIDNTLKEKQIQNNCFSFGIHEYIEIPGVEYIREVGIMGFEVTVVFSRAGKAVEKKKVKRGKSRRLVVSREEIENYLVSNFKTEILRKKKRIMEDENDSE
ncbi:50S ribosomal protein L5 [archaeon]|jgi:large subunit ribosomal protein L5|nr:50S ribosomal protein L5 [archaeon]MBT7128914.1 50S ribosomal protein L5 [archaeon]